MIFARIGHGPCYYHWNEIFAPSVSRKDYYNASVASVGAALCFLGENLVVKMQENKNDDDAIHRS